MTAPERATFSEEKSAILTDPAYSFLSFKVHGNLGVTRLLSQSTGDESSLGATQQRSKLRNQLNFFFSVSVFTIALGIQKKEATVGKETFSTNVALAIGLPSIFYFKTCSVKLLSTLVVHVPLTCVVYSVTIISPADRRAMFL